MLGAIFKKARQDIQNPATLRRLIVELIDTENWSSMQADIKGDIYEGLLGGKTPPKAFQLTKGVQANTSRPANWVNLGSSL